MAQCRPCAHSGGGGGGGGGDDDGGNDLVLEEASVRSTPASGRTRKNDGKTDTILTRPPASFFLSLFLLNTMRKRESRPQRVQLNGAYCT